MSKKISERDRFAGCMVGLAVGDAVGFVVEGHGPELCRAYLRDVIDHRQFKNLGRGQFPFGQYSDDTQLSRELLCSYVSRKEFDVEGFAMRLGAIFASHRIVGRGRSTDASAKRIVVGDPLDKTGEPSPAAGNGSAMRAGPIGLIFAHDRETLLSASFAQSYITHQDSRCGAGSAVIAGAVARSVREETENPFDFINDLALLAREFDEGFAEAVMSLHEWCRLEPDEALQKIRVAGLQPGTESDWPGVSPFVVPSVLWAVYSFLRSPDDFLQVLHTAIACGGDVDTTACMACAIAGANVGLNGVDAELAGFINDQGKWRAKDLSQLAYDAFEIMQQASKNP